MVVEQYIERNGVRLMLSVKNVDANDHGKLVCSEADVRRLLRSIGDDVARVVSQGKGETVWPANKPASGVVTTMR